MNNAYATLVDRTGGPSEIIFDGQRHCFTKDEPEQIMPVEVAEWIFRVTQGHIHSNEQGYVCRYGITKGPNRLIEALGPDALDTTPLTIATRIEGWDTETSPLEQTGRRVVIDGKADPRLRTRPDDYERLPAGGSFASARS